MADYIKYLRAMVGHEPIVLCGASVIVVDENGALLLQKRTDNGCWCYAGGIVELYEDVRDAARRELYEETGLKAKSLSLFGVYSGEGMAHCYPNGDKASIVDVVFLCTDYEGALKPQPEEVTALGFFPPDALPAPINPTSQKALSDYLNRYGRGNGHEADA